MLLIKYTLDKDYIGMIREFGKILSSFDINDIKYAIDNTEDKEEKEKLKEFINAKFIPLSESIWGEQKEKDKFFNLNGSFQIPNPYNAHKETNSMNLFSVNNMVNSTDVVDHNDNAADIDISFEKIDPFKMNQEEKKD